MLSGDDFITEYFIECGRDYEKFWKKLKITFVDTRHWNIELTFDGVHFTEAGHHAFAEKRRKELCL